MPIEKIGDRYRISTDMRSSTMDSSFRSKVCCYLCKETVFTLRRVRDESGSKIRPALYVCSPCNKK